MSEREQTPFATDFDRWCAGYLHGTDAPMNVVCPPMRAAWQARAEIAAEREAELRAENERLRKGINAVRDLINESQGVAGLHLNGDVAEWDELLEGGRLEDWLIDFSKALAATDGKHRLTPPPEIEAALAQALENSSTEVSSEALDATQQEQDDE